MKEKEERDNRLVILVIFVLLVTMVTLILVSGAYARYTSKASGSDVATVAKWSFKVNGTEIGGTTEKEVQFEIFSTLDSESNVAKTDGSLIAPGTKGSFKIQLTNDSEVNAEYKVTYSIENPSNIPLEYSKDGGVSWNKSIDTALNSDSYTPIAREATVDTTTIQWRWAFDGDSTTDTNLGVSAAGASAPKCTIKAVVEAQQVD